MRAFIILILSCASVFGVDSDILIVSTVRTNDSGRVSMKEVFTRNGQTNLVRDTMTKAGVVLIQNHRFFHNGTLVGNFVTMPDRSGFTTQADTVYSVSFEFDAYQKPKSVVIGTKHILALDAFSYTNGVFAPVEKAVLQKANDVFGDIEPMFDPDNVRKTSPEDFRRGIEKLIEKHKDK